MLAPARTKSTRCNIWAMGTDPTQRSQRAEEGFEQARGVYPSPRMKGTGRLFLQFHPFRFDLFCRPLWRICAIRNGIEAEISFISCASWRLSRFSTRKSSPFYPLYTINERSWSWMKGEERLYTRIERRTMKVCLCFRQRNVCPILRELVQNGNVSQCWNYYNSVSKYFLLMYKIFIYLFLYYF